MEFMNNTTKKQKKAGYLNLSQGKE